MSKPTPAKTPEQIAEFYARFSKIVLKGKRPLGTIVMNHPDRTGGLTRTYRSVDHIRVKAYLDLFTGLGFVRDDSPRSRHNNSLK